MREDDVRNGDPVPGQQVDDAGRQTSRQQEFVGEVGRELLRGLGFQMTVLPSNAGALGRLPAMAVRLKGVTA